MKSVIQVSLCVVLISVYAKGDEVPPSFKAKLHQHLQSSRWFWKLAGSHVKTVHPVSFKVNVVSTYNVTKISKGIFQNGNKYRDCATILKKNPNQKKERMVYIQFILMEYKRRKCTVT
ncbi:uncharacterized protein LOC134259515 [Saccostrea cucullata]|uniref:uncharacterized protein LOC134259515 n=1 Tax=Saccostrea cuccullata TaxID=36930 RepID=UPI002ED027D5